MNDDRAQLVKELFQTAAELAGNERDRFLSQCDPTLRAELEGLLGADRQIRDRFLEGRHRAADQPAMPERVGRYQIVRRIGAGGMGTVFEAAQDNPRRAIALKLLNCNLLSPDSLRRFEYEAQVLATLLHPGIAQVYEVGTERIGGVSVPFFAMELIPEARPITDYARGGRLGTSHRLALFAEVCDAVHHGHQKGIIHRDLKPSNVVVDSAGRARVIDFGVARSVQSDAAATLQTSAGRLIGTLPYMSPEQCGGVAHDLDIRSDIYSLGVVLYELLCDRLPYDVGSGSLLEAARIIREQAPARPSGVHRILRGDLETIVLKALEKDRSRRYQTAGELARDIRHYLDNEPIEARRDSTFYILRKTVRRYRTLLAVLLAFVLLVAGSTVLAWTLMLRAGRSAQLAHERLHEAEHKTYASNIAAAAASIAANDGGLALKRLRSSSAALRNWEWRYLLRQADQSVSTWHGPKDLITGRVRLSRDGRYVGASFWMEEREGALRIWPRTSVDPAGELAFAPGIFPPFEFLGNGGELLACDRDGTLSRFDLAERRVTDRRHVPGLRNGEFALDFWPDHQLLLTGIAGGCRLRDTVTGRLLLELSTEDRWIWSRSIDATGARLALGLSDGTVLLSDVVGGRELAQTKAHARMLFGTAFTPDGRLLATASEGGELKLWEIGERTAVAAGSTADRHAPPLPMVCDLRSGTQRIGVVSFSPDGKLLAAPSEDKTVRVWNVGDGELRATLLGHTTGVSCTSFASDARWLLSGARDGVVKLWDLEQSSPVRSFRDLPSAVHSIAFTPDGRRLLLNGKTACVIDAGTGRRLHAHSLPQAKETADILASPDGLHAVFSLYDGSIRVWKLGADGQSRVIGRHKSMPRLAGHPRGRVWASADSEAVVLWEWADSHESRRFVGPGQALRCLALSPDADLLALGLESGALVVQDTETGQLRRGCAKDEHSRAIASVAFSPCGRRLVTGSADGTVGLWDLPQPRLLWRAEPELGDVWCIAFSRDGTRIAAGGRDRSVRLLDSQNGQELLALRGPTGTVMCLAFSPDGERIAAGSWAGEVFVWDAGDPR